MVEINSASDNDRNPQVSDKQSVKSIDALSAVRFRKWFALSATAMAANQEYLTRLDSEIGDADHGNNMHRGLQAVMGSVQSGNDIGAILKAAAMSLISHVGGAAGPLYGTMLLQASKPLTGVQHASADDVAQLLKNFVAGVRKRGRAEAGDKTILDALIPASKAYRVAIETGETMPHAMELAAKAAEQGMISTIPMIARKGRASYLGERSIGHQDPGATSSYLLVQALADASQPDAGT